MCQGNINVLVKRLELENSLRMEKVFNYSVIVPYRDKYNLFKKALDSVPDRSDIQIVIADNALDPLSQESLPNKVNARVTYIRSSPTKGAGCARNEGLKLAYGKFVLFLDADDYFTSNAFGFFDKYLEKDYDIVFFKPTSIYLANGTPSNRHVEYEAAIEEWHKSGNESVLRYRWGTPWAKLFRHEFLLNGNYHFEETPVGNDAWFSTITGHFAKKIVADNAVVYVVTEGESGQSLTKKITKENSLIRYKNAIRINKFLKSVGRYEMHIRLLGFLRIAIKYFGFYEVVKYVKIAYKEKVSIF